MLRIAPISYDVAAHISLKRPFAVLLVNKGEGVLQTNGLRVPLHNQRAFLLRDQTQVSLESGLLTGHLIEFQRNLMDQFLLKNIVHHNKGIFQKEVLLPFADLSIDEFIFILNLIQKLNQELEQGSPVILFQKCFFLLLWEINRKVVELKLEDERQNTDLDKLSVLIDRHYQRERKVDFYAAELGMTVRKLNSLTKKHTGKKFFELLIHRLMLEAEGLLRKDMPIKKIAYQLGFSHHGHLDNHFKKYSGFTPAEFRKKLHKI